MHSSKPGLGRHAGWFLALIAMLALSTGLAGAQDQEAPPGDGPPLPLHTIEGTGGLVLTPTALLVNPGPEGTVVGKPAISTQVGAIGHKDFQAVAMTVTLWRRLELGYAWNRLGLDDFEDDLRVVVPGADVGTGDIQLHHFNARLNLLREGEFDKDWMPALTAGVHYKYNDDIHEIDRRLGGALTGIGLNDNDGIDFTLTATKSVPVLGRPTIISAGGRATKGAQFGLAGFTDDYHLTFETGAVMLLTDRLAVGAEYRQKPDQMGTIPGVVESEDDWWDVHAAYIINDHAEVYAAVGEVGSVLNQNDELFYAGVFKYEF